MSGDAKERLQGLIQQDQEAASEQAQLVELDRLCRYQRDLFRLLNNFVNFSAVYKSAERALVDMGSAWLAGVRGSLGLISVLSCVMFAAICGSSA